MGDAESLSQLLATGHTCVRLVTRDEQEARQAVLEAAITRDAPLKVWTAVTGVRDGKVDGPSVPDTLNLAAACVHIIRDHLLVPTKGDSTPCITLLIDASPAMLQDHVAARAWRELVETASARGTSVIMIDSGENTLPVVSAISTPFELSLPNEEALDEIIRKTLKVMHKKSPLAVEINKKDYATIVKNLRGLTARQARQIIMDVVSTDRSLNIYDLNSILAKKRQLLQSGGLLEYVKSPVDMGAIGGLDTLKTWLLARKDAVADEAKSFGIDPPRGVLILGVQGAGKSLCAKAIATAWQRPLLRMDMGALYDKFVGESERNLREALHQAEVMAPNVLWFDEIEKAFAGTSSSGGGSDAGLSKRMFGMLLTWMQEHRSGVFVAATANDIDSLPPELMRKGRFDEIFFVDLPKPSSRKAIFSIHLQKRQRDPKAFDLAALVAASEGFSGAEIEQAIVSSMFAAYAEGKRDLTTADILTVLASSPPLSVTRAEKIAELREWSEGRCLKAE